MKKQTNWHLATIVVIFSFQKGANAGKIDSTGIRTDSFVCC